MPCTAISTADALRSAALNSRALEAVVTMADERSTSWQRAQLRKLGLALSTVLFSVGYLSLAHRRRTGSSRGAKEVVLRKISTSHMPGGRSRLENPACMWTTLAQRWVRALQIGRLQSSQSDHHP